MSLLPVSYVIITRNRSDELFGCLENLQKQAYPDKEIVVVDNGSTTYDPQEITHSFPEITLIALDHNQGVGGGRNIGTQHASADICIFLDDDARFCDPDASRQIVTYFQRNPKLACLALRILNATTGEDEHKAIPRADKKSLPRDYSCTYFCGAGFALRRKVFHEMGNFWEELIYSCEELDLSYRLLDHGFELLFTSSIKVLHRDSSNARPNGQWIYYNARNRFWLATRHLPWFYVFTTTLQWWFIAAGKGLRYNQTRSFFQGVRDALLGIKIPLLKRKRLKKATIKKLRRLSGRLWS
ncbi:glycosyltransferase family 2 protein [candidate division CSSED10-310 bacterium]|uniref:Glycosyltransferase family 2 protein n=1 Tax=candidate division CSSED10-310 bacterium TaxID=2855610 RepID=A0ABV6YYA1_UNCC1